MRVAPQVFQNLPWAAKRALGIHHPLDVLKGGERGVKVRAISKGRKISMKRQCPLGERPVQPLQEQAAKQPREYAHRQEEPRATGDPALSIGR